MDFTEVLWKCEVTWRTGKRFVRTCWSTASVIRTIVEHRADRPVELFPLDGRPHLAHVRVETTDVSSYQTLLSHSDSIEESLP